MRNDRDQLLFDVVRGAFVLSFPVWLAAMVVGATTWPQHEVDMRYSHQALHPLQMIIAWYADEAWAVGARPAGNVLTRVVFVSGHVFALFVQAVGASAAILGLVRDSSFRTLRGVALSLLSFVFCFVLSVLVLTMFTVGTL